jgi:hypothetical protein
MSRDLQALLFLVASLAVLVLLAYGFAQQERRSVIFECMDRAASLEQLAACRGLPRNHSFF